jgi:hypothetical protein
MRRTLESGTCSISVLMCPERAEFDSRFEVHMNRCGVNELWTQIQRAPPCPTTVDVEQTSRLPPRRCFRTVYLVLSEILDKSDPSYNPFLTL